MAIGCTDVEALFETVEDHTANKVIKDVWTGSGTRGTTNEHQDHHLHCPYDIPL